MPSTIVHSQRAQEGPVAKRQKLSGDDAPRATRQESRIFAPFRVRRISVPLPMVVPLLILLLDHWAGILNTRPIHLYTARQDNLPDNYLRGPMSPDLRLEAWTQSYVPHPTADPRGHYIYGGMEGSSIRSMGRLYENGDPRILGIQARQEN